MSVTIDREFAPAQESIDWAKQAIEDLHRDLARFFDQPDVIEVVTEIDAQTGEYVKKVRVIKDVPNAFRRKATEALNNARHSFDQSVFAARNIVGKRSAKGGQLSMGAKFSRSRPIACKKRD